MLAFMLSLSLAVVQATGGARFKDVMLPAGDVPGWSIDFANWSGHGDAQKMRSSSWLGEHDGIRFVGQGRDVTHIRPGAADATILVARHGGTVRIESATIHCGASQGIFFGLETPGVRVEPKFRLELHDVAIVSDPPQMALMAGSSEGDLDAGARGYSRVLLRAARDGTMPAGLSADEIGVFNAYRSWFAEPEIGEPEDAQGPVQRLAISGAGPVTTTKWGIFGYQHDVVVTDSTIDLRHSAEHGQYTHGFARDGVFWARVHVVATGAEQLKLTARPWECGWVTTARVVVKDSVFEDWYQPWSWRGGAGIVDQGAGVPLRVVRCVFRNPGPSGAIPASQRTRCIMVDDSADNDGDGVRDFYGYETGRVGVGFANGPVRIRECAFYAGPGVDSYSILVRIGKLGTGNWLAAPSFSMTGCGLYGEKVQLQLRDCAPGGIVVADCNTKRLEELMPRVGVRVSSGEAVIPLADRVVPASNGLVR